MKNNPPPAGHGVIIERCPRTPNRYRVINEDGMPLGSRKARTRADAIKAAWRRIDKDVPKAITAVLKETSSFIAIRSGDKVTIKVKDRNTTPGQRTISGRTWNQMKDMSDNNFDATCIMDLGIGVFQKG